KTKVKVPITTIIMPRIFGKPLLKNKLATIIKAVKTVYITVINDRSINCPIVNTKIKATINPFNNALNPYTPSHSHHLHSCQFLSQAKVDFISVWQCLWCYHTLRKKDISSS